MKACNCFVHAKPHNAGLCSVKGKSPPAEESMACRRLCSQAFVCSRRCCASLLCRAVPVSLGTNIYMYIKTVNAEKYLMQICHDEG